MLHFVGVLSGLLLKTALTAAKRAGSGASSGGSASRGSGCDLASRARRLFPGIGPISPFPRGNQGPWRMRGLPSLSLRPRCGAWFATCALTAPHPTREIPMLEGFDVFSTGMRYALQRVWVGGGWPGTDVAPRAERFCGTNAVAPISVRWRKALTGGSETRDSECRGTGRGEVPLRGPNP